VPSGRIEFRELSPRRLRVWEIARGQRALQRCSRALGVSQFAQSQREVIVDGGRVTGKCDRLFEDIDRLRSFSALDIHESERVEGCRFGPQAACLAGKGKCEIEIPMIVCEQPGQIVSSSRVGGGPSDDRSEPRFGSIPVSSGQYELSGCVGIRRVARIDSGGAIEELDRAFGVSPRTRKCGHATQCLGVVGVD